MHEHVGPVASEVAHLEVFGDGEGQRLPVVHEREVVRTGRHGVDRVPRVDLVGTQHDLRCGGAQSADRAHHDAAVGRRERREAQGADRVTGRAEHP